MWDTAGQEEFERIRVLSYENTTCFLVCFSVADLVTFENIKQKWLPELRRNNPDSKVLLVGLKCDLRKSKEERKANTGSGGIKRDKEVMLNKLCNDASTKIKGIITLIFYNMNLQRNIC